MEGIVEAADPSCKVTEGTLALNYDLRDSDIEVHLGVTNRSEISEAKGGLKVEEIVIHPEYDPTSENSPFDLALFKLAVKVELSRRIQPICLATPDLVEPAEATVAGWGFQYHNCQTDFWGPRKFEPCSPLWTYNGKRYEQECARGIDPPRHPACEEFYRAVKTSLVQPAGPVVIETEAGRVDCPPLKPPTRTYYGWCGSCEPKDEHGDADDDDETELIV